jgi:hypothetical protein
MLLVLALRFDRSIKRDVCMSQCDTNGTRTEQIREVASRFIFRQIC